MTPVQVKSLRQLKAIIRDGEKHAFDLRLSGGAISCKSLWLEGKAIVVMNWIDDSIQELTEKQLMSKGAEYTMIGDAIRGGAFWYTGLE